MKRRSNLLTNDEKNLEWLKNNISKYEKFTQNLETYLNNLLNDKKVKFFGVIGRTKTLDSASAKIIRKNYFEPEHQLTDLIGLRIVIFFESQITEICKLIYSKFDVDVDNSQDLAQTLGKDKIGYRSIHYVCTLKPLKEYFPESNKFWDLKFEIQIRTVLQHAWAEISHDKAYKVSRELPANIQRKLNLFAANLELIDQGFDEIAIAIESYEKHLKETDINNFLEEKINSINVKKFIENANLEHDLGLREVNIEKRDIEELKKFGIKTLLELKSVFTDEFFSKEKKAKISGNYIGFLRLGLMFEDVRKYFKTNQTRDWRGFPENVYDFLRSKFGASIMDEIVNEYELDILKNTPPRIP